ncbi:MAG TPA: hypothetical protein VMH04_13555 [Candidatus Solibacter sp.]|nr:hypothetical protein [Candidatus Solibacter sp.]
MFFLKLTLYTCAFYLAIATPIIALELVSEHWFGGFGIHFSGRAGVVGFVGFWGIVWLASFLGAARIVVGPGLLNRLMQLRG